MTSVAMAMKFETVGNNSACIGDISEILTSNRVLGVGLLNDVKFHHDVKEQ